MNSMVEGIDHVITDKKRLYSFLVQSLVCDEWFVNHLRTVHEPNARICERNCEPVLRCPRMVPILDALCVLSMQRLSFARLRLVEN